MLQSYDIHLRDGYGRQHVVQATGNTIEAAVSVAMLHVAEGKDRIGRQIEVEGLNPIINRERA